MYRTVPPLAVAVALFVTLVVVIAAYSLLLGAKSDMGPRPPVGPPFVVSPSGPVSSAPAADQTHGEAAQARGAGDN